MEARATVLLAPPTIPISRLGVNAATVNDFHHYQQYTALSQFCLFLAHCTFACNTDAQNNRNICERQEKGKTKKPSLLDLSNFGKNRVKKPLSFPRASFGFQLSWKSSSKQTRWRRRESKSSLLTVGEFSPGRIILSWDIFKLNLRHAMQTLIIERMIFNT